MGRIDATHSRSLRAVSYETIQVRTNHWRLVLEDRTLHRLTIDLYKGLSVRIVVGVVTGSMFALAGWFAGWFFLLRPGAGLTEAMFVLALSTGVVGGLGAAVAWLRPDDGVPANIPAVLLALAGGIFGAWAGLAYASAVLGLAASKGEGDITAITAAGIAANIPPPLYLIARHFRERRRDE